MKFHDFVIVRLRMYCKSEEVIHFIMFTVLVTLYSKNVFLTLVNALAKVT